MKFGATRIGVHAGPALVGNFGGNRFFDYRRVSPVRASRGELQAQEDAAVLPAGLAAASPMTLARTMAPAEPEAVLARTTHEPRR